MAFGHFAGTDYAAVDAVAYQPRLGQQAWSSDRETTNYGKRLWIYVENDGSGAFAAGDVIIQNTATAVLGKGILSTATTAVSAFRVLGVAQHAIAENAGGWILQDGVGEVALYNAGATAAGAMIGVAGTSGGAGDAEVVAATEPAIGMMIDAHTSATATEVLTAMLRCSQGISGVK